MRRRVSVRNRARCVVRGRGKSKRHNPTKRTQKAMLLEANTTSITGGSCQKSSFKAGRKPDPIFAAIERHAQARDAHNAAASALADMEDKISEGRKEKGTHWSQSITLFDPRFYLMGGPENAAASFTAREQVKPYVCRMFDDLCSHIMPKTAGKVRQLEKDAREEIERAFDAFWAKIETERKSTGLTAAREASDDTCLAEKAALTALARVKPRTEEGRKTLLKHLATFEPNEWWAVSKVMQRLAGD